MLTNLRIYSHTTKSKLSPIHFKPKAEPNKCTSRNLFTAYTPDFLYYILRCKIHTTLYFIHTFIWFFQVWLAFTFCVVFYFMPLIEYTTCKCSICAHSLTNLTTEHTITEILKMILSVNQLAASHVTSFNSKVRGFLMISLQLYPQKGHNVFLFQCVMLFSCE